MLACIEVTKCLTNAGLDGIDTNAMNSTKIGSCVGGENLAEELPIVLVERPAIARDEIANIHLVEGVLQAGSVLVAHDVTVARSR